MDETDHYGEGKMGKKGNMANETNVANNEKQLW